MHQRLLISIFFTLFSIKCKKYLVGTHDRVSPPKQSRSVSVGGADYQNQPATCMPGYPCCGVCPVCEHSNQVNNRRKEQQKGTTLSN